MCIFAYVKLSYSLPVYLRAMSGFISEQVAPDATHKNECGHNTYRGLVNEGG